MAHDDTTTVLTTHQHLVHVDLHPLLVLALALAHILHHIVDAIIPRRRRVMHVDPLGCLGQTIEGLDRIQAETETETGTGADEMIGTDETTEGETEIKTVIDTQIAIAIVRRTEEEPPHLGPAKTALPLVLLLPLPLALLLLDPPRHRVKSLPMLGTSYRIHS